MVETPSEPVKFRPAALARAAPGRPISISALGPRHAARPDRRGDGERRDQVSAQETEQGEGQRRIFWCNITPGLPQKAAAGDAYGLVAVPILGRPFQLLDRK